MRDYDDDNIRLYTPVLQRVIILLAVIIAVPVVMWTITTFVRTYVAPPKAPTFQRMTETQPRGHDVRRRAGGSARSPAAEHRNLPHDQPVSRCADGGVRRTDALIDINEAGQRAAAAAPRRQIATAVPRQSASRLRPSRLRPAAAVQPVTVASVQPTPAAGIGRRGGASAVHGSNAGRPAGPGSTAAPADHTCLAQSKHQIAA